MTKRWLPLVFLLMSCGRTEVAAPTETAAPKPKVAPPSLAEAQQIVAESGPFGEFEFDQAAVSVPVTLDPARAEATAVAIDLEREGWIAIDDQQVTFTDKAKSDKRFLMRQNGFFDVVPLAKKRMIAAKSILEGNDGQVHVLFQWEWQPNEIGSRIDVLQQRYAGVQDSVATLIHDGTAWNVLTIKRSL